MQKEVRNTIGLSFEKLPKRIIVVLLGSFLLQLVGVQAKKMHLAVRDSYSHCTGSNHYKSMTNWKCINKYTDKIGEDKMTLKKQLRMVG